MNYIFYIITTTALMGAIGIPLYFRQRLRLDFFNKRAVRHALRHCDILGSEGIALTAVKAALKSGQNNAAEALADGKFNLAATLLSKKLPIIAVLLGVFKRPKTALKSLEKICKNTPDNAMAQGWLALLHGMVGDKNKAALLWSGIKEQKLPPYLHGHYHIYIAESALRNGDLELASKQFYLAALRFGRCKAYHDEAAVYLKLGTIYRICFVFDTAESWFRSAWDIYKKLKHSRGEALVYANLGMLMTGQERFEEARDFFAKAEKIYAQFETLAETAYIKNQIALTHILQKNYRTAQKSLNNALKLFEESKDINGLAFGYELKADNDWQQQHFASTVRWAKKASALYQKCNNITGLLESSYLLAQGLFRLGDDTQAEEILRQIIDYGKKDCGGFYLANAYNLLGIIFMKRQDLRRAKGLFRQSLELEQRGNRITALATDYANIGLNELCCGRRDDADKNLQTALELAESCGDEDLCRCLRHHLDKLKN